MEIRRLSDADDRLAVSGIYEASWKYAYRDILSRDYLERIPAGRWHGPARRSPPPRGASHGPDRRGAP